MRRTLTLVALALLGACAHTEPISKTGGTVTTSPTTVTTSPTTTTIRDDPTCGDNDPRTMCKDGRFLSGDARIKTMTDCAALADEVNTADAKKKTLAFNSDAWKTQNGYIVAGAGRMQKLGCFK